MDNLFYYVVKEEVYVVFYVLLSYKYNLWNDSISEYVNCTKDRENL